ncbi:hypothetical protein, partial [Bacillus thuringiensis]|uniref:hypothetical protein n=1 Tax=Bacillus thuringiensis TaxID=1428 RepID=UPI002DBC7FEC
LFCYNPYIIDISLHKYKKSRDLFFQPLLCYRIKFSFSFRTLPFFSTSKTSNPHHNKKEDTLKVSSFIDYTANLSLG